MTSKIFTTDVLIADVLLLVGLERPVSEACLLTKNESFCVLLGYYAATSGNLLPTFRDNPSTAYSRSATSVRNYHYSLCNNAEERGSQERRLYRYPE